MIAKGKIRAEGAKLARYLMTGEPGEIAQLIETRGLETFGGDPVAAFAAMELTAQAHTRSTKPLFHGHIRLAPGERLSDEKWMEALERMEKRLGFAGQPRAVSFHIDQATGEKHLHVAWFRVDLETMRAIDPGMYKNHLKELSRRLEKEFALREVSSTRQPHDRARAAGRNELEESRRLGTDVREIRTAILDSLEQSDGGKAFKAALEGRGFLLANGDRRDCFVVIDPAGGQHALNKKLTGLTLMETRDRLADLDRSQLPSVDRAKEMQAAREAQEREKHGRGADGQGRDNRPASDPQRSAQPEIKPLGQTAGEIRLAWRLTKTAEQFARAIEDRGLILVHVSREEAEDSFRASAFHKTIGRQSRALKEGFAVVDRRGNVTRIDQRATGDHWEEIQKRLAGIDRRELVSVADAKEAMREAARVTARDEERQFQDQQRPLTGLERTIAEALAGAMTGAEFASALDEKGLTLTRANAADVLAVEALRRQEELGATAARANAESNRDGLHIDRLTEGDYAVVTRRGDVFRLNPTALDFEEAEQRLGDVQPRMPGVVEARALNEVVREREATQRAEGRDEAARARELRAENFEAERASARFDAVEIKGGIKAAENEIGAAPMEAARAGRDGLRLIAKVAEFMLGLFGGWAMAPPKLTPDQAELAERTAEEQAQQNAQAAEDAERKEFIDQLVRNGRRREEDDLARRLADQLRRDLETRGRETDHSRGRERER